MKIIKACIFLLAFIFARLNALELNIANDINDISSTKNINVCFEFDKQTQAVLCSSINFSVDNPNILITDSACIQRPSVQFLQNFKRGKKVFTQSFYYELKINTGIEDKQLIFEELKKSSLYTSCIIIEKSGHVRSLSLCNPIYDEFWIGSSSQKFAMNDVSQADSLSTLTSFFIRNRLQNLSTCKNFEKEPENIAVDKLSSLTSFVAERINCLAVKIDFFLFYLIIFVLMILLLVLIARYAFARTWLAGFLRMLIFAWFILTFLFFKSHLVLYKFYVGLAALFIIVAFYYIFSAKTNSAKDKLKSLLGFILAAISIPLLLKAFLSLTNL